MVRTTIAFLLCSVVGIVVDAQSMYDLINGFREDKYALQRMYTVSESVEYYERMKRFYDAYEERVAAVNFDNLAQDGKADYLLLKNQLAKEVYNLNIEKGQFDQVYHTLEFGVPLYDFVQARRDGARPDAEKLAGMFHDVTQKLNQAMSELKTKPFSSEKQAVKAAGAVDELESAVLESYKFYKGYDPIFTWWTETPFDTLHRSLNHYATFLRKNYQTTAGKDDGSGIVGKPIGRDAIIKSLQTEFIPYTPEELIKIAETEFKWCEQEMKKAAQAMGFGTDWKLALERVKKTYVAPGEQPALVTKLANEAIEFLEKNDLVTIPDAAKETWRMKMMSPEAQKLNPFFTGGEVITISYPTNDMHHDQKMMSMRGNNPYFSKATVHHELIPGHHLQQFMQKRYKPYRSVFATPFWIEGWALYWEMNLWDKGFASSPEDKVGMLFWRMHRCARIIFSLSYHLEKMTPKQCIDFLVDKVGHEYANAEAEVRRSFTGGYGPLYQIAYMIGGLQIYHLKKEAIGSLKITEKQFHDRVLRENCIPIEVLRGILLDQNWNKGFTTEWKFMSHQDE
ncbi:MAG TPA: DUF885 family protein [Ohtaekwangia sp.]|nr:DUF885 family protein [Ohtaekwangia sp.]